MGDPEVFSGQAIEKIARNRFARSKSDAMHKAVKSGPMACQVSKELFYLRVIAHVAIKNKFGIEIAGKFRDPIFKTLSNVAKSQFSALRAARPGDAVCNGAVGQHTCNQQFFAC